jgi:transcriptional regulator with XRE-family HTH domain
MMGGQRTNDLPGLGNRLRQAREAAGLSQEQVARTLGLPRPAVTEMENETRKVSAGELKDLTELYKVSLEWLTGDVLNQSRKVKIAARKLEALKEQDLDAVIRIIDSLQRTSSNE